MGKCKICKKSYYCKRCGEKLVLQTKIYVHYDHITGERVDLHYHYWRCPNKFWVLDKHTTADDAPWDW